MTGTEATSGRTMRAAESVPECGRSAAEMIDKAGAAAWPDRVEVEFGLKFAANGGVIMAGVAGEVAMRLNVDEGSPVVVRRRIFLLEGQPAALCDSHYPADWASGTAIERPERIRGGVYALIEDPEGPIRRQIARSVDDLVTRMPTHEEAVELRLPPGVAVVRVLRTVFDSNDLPVEVQDSVVAADRHEFRYEEQMR